MKRMRSHSHEPSTKAGLRIAHEFRHSHAFYGTILILTNSRSFADGEAALATGCDGYLCKHTKMGDVTAMITELKAAIRGDVMVVSRELSHVFFRGDVTPKEACLMTLKKRQKAVEIWRKRYGITKVAPRALG